jgi:hypothetical protein
MDHVRIFKELHSLACLLEDNGKFIESSKITNVMTRIAQVAPAGSPTPGNPPAGNLTKEELQKRSIEYNKKYFNEMLKLRDIAQYFLNKGKPTEYTIDSRGYVIKVNDKTYQKPTIEELVTEINSNEQTNLQVPEAPADNKYIEKIAKDIDSAADWPDPENDPSITKAINEKYSLGYNLLGGTYYIQDRTNAIDVADETDINKLREVFSNLGTYYKNNKSFPKSIMIIQSENTQGITFMDPNIAILEAFEKSAGEKWKYLKDKYSKYYNFEAMKRGFVQEYNRRNPKNQISLDNAQSLAQA